MSTLFAMALYKMIEINEEHSVFILSRIWYLFGKQCSLTKGFVIFRIRIKDVIIMLLSYTPSTDIS